MARPTQPPTGSRAFRALEGRESPATAPVGLTLDFPPGGLEVLAEQIAEAMTRDWERGVHRPAEDYLARHPEITGHPAAAVRVVYEEICLREWLGQEVAPRELLRRFPCWREEIRVLLDCHQLVHPRAALPAMPAVGEVLGDFRLRAVLGRGMRGCVFLATQETLADRPVVLKITAIGGGEHLRLARLQHPNVVPLYMFQDFPGRDLRILCLPYLGGATLDRILARLSQQPVHAVSGTDLLRVLDASRTEWVVAPAWSGPRQFLAAATYPRAVCWLGACLADALHYAHTRGLVHLDLKPSNILLADDGQPMLLDFHLASSPLALGDARPEHLGGTPGYMSPEQAAVLAAIRTGTAIPSAVDGRSDIHSLGVVLFEALLGALPPPLAPVAGLVRLLRTRPRLDSGLAQVIARCLATDPADRFPDAASLATDLRRHLGCLPTEGNARRRRVRRWLGSWLPVQH